MKKKLTALPAAALVAVFLGGLLSLEEPPLSINSYDGQILLKVSTTTIAVSEELRLPRLPEASIESGIPFLSSWQQNKGYDFELSIPAINVRAGVLGMGLAPDGKMAVPDNFTEASWYNLGARPGNTGNAVIGAHVDNGGSIDGLFKRLKDLKIGDEVTMTDRNNKTLRFKIMDRNIYPYNLKDTRSVFGPAKTARLNLITCYGTFMPQLNTYDKRLVVVAELQN